MKKIELSFRKLLLKNYLYYLAFTLSILFAWTCINIRYESTYNGNETDFVGEVSEIKYSGGSLMIVLKTPEKIRMAYYFNSEKEMNYYKENLKLGMKLKVIGTLNEPINNTVPNTFNYKNYLYYHNIFYTCKVDSFKIIESKVSLLYEIKNFVIDRIYSFEDTKDYLMTFIIGDKSLMDDEEFENYRSNGVTHLFAISGMHVGLFSGFLLKLLKKLRLSENKSYVFTVLFIWFYAFLTGFTPSVLRAGVLFTLLSLNKIFYLEVKSINCLLFGGTILLFMNPFLIKDIGFLYSFMTTFGLIYSSSALEKHKILGTSLVAFLFSMPITINNFYEVNFLSIIINIIFVPLVSVVVYPLCLISFVFSFLEPIVILSLKVLTYLNSFMAKFNFLTIIIPKMPIVIIVFYYLVLMGLVNKRFKFCLLILSLILCVNKVISKLDSSYYMEVIDVGQGDSILFRSPHNKEIILLDTGGQMSFITNEEWNKKDEYHVASNTITYLKSLGINRIDKLILSHGDADHLGDALYIVENFNVGIVIFNNDDYNSLELKLITLLNKKKINYYKHIKELNIGNNKMIFLNNGLYDNENDNSNVIYVEIEGFKMILMGDAGVVVEENILKTYNIRDIDILKVGHHGSKTSSGEKFVNSINPKYALIPVGRNNKFGHPNKEVLNNLKYTKIYRTDQDGSIIFKIKNNKLKIETCSP